MSTDLYSSQTAIKVMATVPDDGELILHLPFAAGKQVNILVLADGMDSEAFNGSALPLAWVHTEPQAPQVPADPTAEPTLDPQLVSNMLADLTREIMDYRKQLFGAPTAETPKESDAEASA
jgi:hypothetical protein